jgi:serine/threonine protein phosphatase PrpC
MIIIDLRFDALKLMQLSNAGGRLVIASDGVWDALGFQEALNYTRGLPAEAAANRIVKVLKHFYAPDVSVPVVHILVRL